MRPAFEANFGCERENAQAACIPITPMSLSFSASITVDNAKRIEIAGPDGAAKAAKLPDDISDIRSLTFPGPFKESSSYTIRLPAGLTDDTGRPLSNAARFPMTVKTDTFPPLAKFSARFGIIEAADPVLPVTVRNLEAQIRGARHKASGPPPPTGVPLNNFFNRLDARVFGLTVPEAPTVISWLRKVASASRQRSVFAEDKTGGEPKRFKLPKPNGAKAFEVMGIPLGKPGLYIVELKSARLGSVLLGKDAPMYVPTAALVTNLSVHFKQGAANSLVWVTTLEDARPVAGAAVAIANCHGDRLWAGTTDRLGLALVPKIDGVNNPAEVRRRCAHQV